MRTNRDRILEYLEKTEREHKENYRGSTTQEMEEALGMKRCNISTQLNRMTEEGLLKKSGTRRVYYRLKTADAQDEHLSFPCFGGKRREPEERSSAGEGRCTVSGKTAAYFADGSSRNRENKLWKRNFRILRRNKKIFCGHKVEGNQLSILQRKRNRAFAGTGDQQRKAFAPESFTGIKPQPSGGHFPVFSGKGADGRMYDRSAQQMWKIRQSFRRLSQNGSQCR